MAKTSTGDKAGRVLRLLLNVRLPRIARALAAHGFGEAQIQEGWRLLHELSTVPLEPARLGTTNPGLAELDAWENRWFPIAGVALARHVPAVHARLFGNLAQTRGNAVALSVDTFVARYDELVASATAPGLEAHTAKELLDERGLTREVVDEARALLASLRRRASASLAPQDPAGAKRAAATAALWSWYIEWSAIARIAIRERVLLVQLGLLTPRVAKESDEAA